MTAVKEALFWQRLYHDHDSSLEILVPGQMPHISKYGFLRRSFEVSSLPTLVLTDKPTEEFPDRYIKMTPGFFTESLLGKDFQKLRDIMDYLHNLLMLAESIDKVRKDLLKKHFGALLVKAWSEIRELVSFSVA